MGRLYVMCSGGKGSGVPIRQRILEELKDGDPRSLMEISDNIESSSDRKTYEVLEDLEAEGLIQSNHFTFPSTWRKIKAEI